MTTTMAPYFNFDATAREAMTFYQSVFGGNLELSTFGQYGVEGVPADGIMHANLTTDAGFTLNGADTTPFGGKPTGDAFSVSLSGDDAAQLRGYWDKLADGGQITMPLERQVWGDEFGQLVDRYGVAWMVNIASGEG